MKKSTSTSSSTKMVAFIFSVMTTTASLALPVESFVLHRPSSSSSSSLASILSPSSFSPSHHHHHLHPATPSTSAIRRLLTQTKGSAAASSTSLLLNQRGGSTSSTTTLTVASSSATSSFSSSSPSKGELWNKLRVWVFVSLWYVFNVAFNIYNKKVLNALPLPWFVSIAQLGLGAIYAMTLWLVRVRRMPSIDNPDLKKLSILSILHAVSHISAITSLGAGAVSFTHIVKSAEPFFSAMFAGLFFRQFFNPLVYAALIPVVSGVAYASLKELTFTWLSFWCAMASNVACAARGVVVKGMMGVTLSKSKNLTSSNMYSVLTIMSALMLIPFGMVFEGPQLLEVWKAAAAHPSLPGGEAELARYLIYSALTFFLYNEVAFLALESLHPISHAVANTIKRVVIIVVSVLVFRNPMSTQSIVGSTVAVVGVLLYSLAKHYCK